ncbi:hypothetical protein WUBG_08500 [Wuchereria bancrofti]|uniref:Uncharacterized protein n=1 Tax=Wuchereria bancrofti TaxID=6293 RepID=J9EDR3_WUCBA|nr:hypothetical protein WUBG_08500 [Wuchereria bancrofti]
MLEERMEKGKEKKGKEKKYKDEGAEGWLDRWMVVEGEAVKERRCRSADRY